MRFPVTVCVLSLLVVVIAAKKAHKENLAEGESRSHGAKKYAKEHQNIHHVNHKKEVPEEIVSDSEPSAKQAPLEVPEEEVELQGHLEPKRVVEEREKDLHLQDLAYEETLQKEKRHHRTESEKKKKGGKAEKKLFAEPEADLAVDEKVIEDSFEPLEQEPLEGEKAPTKKSTKKHVKEEKKHAKEEKKHVKEEKKRGGKEEKKNKEKTKNKKAYEKQGKDKKQKEGGKKNKDKKHKKEKKY